MEWLIAVAIALVFCYVVGAGFMIFVGTLLLAFPSFNAPTHIPPQGLAEVLRVGLLWFYYMFRKEPRDG